MKPKNKKINILYCIEYLGAGGTEKQLVALMHGLDKNKFTPHLCCLRSSMIGSCRKDEAHHYFNEMPFAKIQLDFVSFKKVKTVFELFKLIRYLKKNNIDIIQTFFQDPTVIGLIAGKLAHVKPIIASFRDLGFWRDQENDLKMRLTYRACSAYIANSLAVQRVFVDAYGLPAEKVQVIYNGIAFEKFHFREPIINTPGRPRRVGIIANFNRKVKRHDIFIKAAKLVADKINAVEFIIAGSGELKPELMSLARELHIAERINFYGVAQDIPEFLKTIDVGVITSDTEGFSNTILEYMAAGVPVVATAVGGNLEIITDGVNGFLAPAGDYVSISEKINNLLLKPELVGKITEKAHDDICQKYSIRGCIAQYEDYYLRTVLENSPNC